MITTPTLGAQLVPIVSSSERERLTGFAAGEAGIPPPPDIDLCVLGGGAMTRQAAVGAITPDAAGTAAARDIWGFTREDGHKSPSSLCPPKSTSAAPPFTIIT